MEYKIIIKFLVLSLVLFSCGRKPIFEVTLNEEVIPMNAFTANLKIYNPYESKIKINSLKRGITLYSYIYNKAKAEWRVVSIGHRYVILDNREIINRKFLNPKDTINIYYDLTPLELLNENEEYILRTVYYIGRKKKLYKEPFKIDGSKFKNISDCLLIDIEIKVSELNEFDHKAMSWLREMSPRHNLSLAHRPSHEMQNELINFIESYEESSYGNRAKLVYSKEIYSNDPDKTKIANAIKFLEELLTKTNMKHHRNWIESRLSHLKNID